MKEERAHPMRIILDNGEDFYICAECENECQPNGDCFEGAEPCYYCPQEDTCTTCGRGYCDQSC